MHKDAKRAIISVYADRLKKGVLSPEEQKEVSSVMSDVAVVFTQMQSRIDMLEEIIQLSIAEDAGEEHTENCFELVIADGLTMDPEMCQAMIEHIADGATLIKTHYNVCDLTVTLARPTDEN